MQLNFKAVAIRTVTYEYLRAIRYSYTALLYTGQAARVSTADTQRQSRSAW